MNNGGKKKKCQCQFKNNKQKQLLPEITERAQTI